LTNLKIKALVIQGKAVTAQASPACWGTQLMLYDFGEGQEMQLVVWTTGSLHTLAAKSLPVKDAF